MVDTLLKTEEHTEQRVVRIASRPISFDKFLDICGPKDFYELLDGILVEKPMVQWNHGVVEGWLYHVLGVYVTRRGLGAVASSRIAVEIDEYRGRLPDLLFVRQDHMDIITPKALRGAPDLIVEVLSPNDNPSDVIALERDYRAIGVPEIWFLDPQKGRARLLNRRGDDWEETILTEGWIASETVDGFRVRAEWLLQGPHPDPLETVLNLLNETNALQ